MREVLLKGIDPGRQDRSDAAKLFFRAGMSSLESLLDGLLHLEDIGWDETSLCHEQGLVASLGEVLKNPTILHAVFHLDALHDEAHEGVILDLSPLVLQLLSNVFTLSGILVHELLDQGGKLEMHQTDLLS